jgi:hypothetical protein
MRFFYAEFFLKIFSMHSSECISAPGWVYDRTTFNVSAVSTGFRHFLAHLRQQKQVNVLNTVIPSAMQSIIFLA